MKKTFFHFVAIIFIREGKRSNAELKSDRKLKDNDRLLHLSSKESANSQLRNPILRFLLHHENEKR